MYDLGGPIFLLKYVYKLFTCETEVQHLFLIGGKGSVYKTCSVVIFKRLTLDMEVIALLVMGNMFTIQR